MQKKDLFNHITLFDKWREGITPKYIEDRLTKDNSKLFVDYFIYLGNTKTKGYVHRNMSKIKSIFIGLQNKGIDNISKIKEKEVNDYFLDWCKSHSIDYPMRFLAFWNWLKKTMRKEGEIIKDIVLNIEDFKRDKKESIFVWITKEQFDKFRSYFNEDKQTILLFCFDSIIRCPTELLSLKVENVFEKNGEVWLDIPKEISKTIGRKFNLVYSGEAILKYIERHNKKPEDYLFDFSHNMFNQEMQKVAKQLFDGKKSEGGEYFKNITMYDLRHSGAIHFRQLFQKTGQSLDLLRERGGWSNFDMINWYTKRLGLDGHIQKEKLLLQEDKTNLEKQLDKTQKTLSAMNTFNLLKEDLMIKAITRQISPEKFLKELKELEEDRDNNELIKEGFCEKLINP